MGTLLGRGHRKTIIYYFARENSPKSETYVVKFFLENSRIVL